MQEFTLFGNKVVIYDGRSNYNYYRITFDKLSEELFTTFYENYYVKFHNIREVVNYAPDYGKQLIMQAVDKAIDELNKKKVFGIDCDRFIRENGEVLSPWYEACENVRRKYTEVINRLNDEMEYRQERKDNRDRMVGGGFGIEGAVKGAVTAGAMNLASGLIHDGINAVGNSMSQKEANATLDRYYNDPAIRDEYVVALGQTVFQIHYFLCKEIMSNTEVEIDGIHAEDADEAKALFNNISAGKIPEDALWEQILRVVDMNPYLYDLYDFLLKKYGDEQNEIEVIATYFGYDICATKTKNIEYMLKDADYHNQEEINRLLDSVKGECDRYGLEFEKYKETVLKVQNMVQHYFLTVDDVTYDDEETAKEVKNCINEWIGAIESDGRLSEDKINDLIVAMKDSKCKSADKYIERLEKHLCALNSYYLSVKGIEYTNREEAKVAREENERAIELLFCNELEQEEQLLAVKAELQGMSSGIKDDYIELLEFIIVLRKKQQELQQKTDFSTTDRKTLTFSYLEALQLMQTEWEVGSISSEFRKWLAELEERILVVNQKRYETVKDANKAYNKVLSHARAYLAYVAEKNTEKKGFFASLKNSASGVVSKGYESEYNYMTNNGETEIPDVEVSDESLQIMYDVVNAERDKRQVEVIAIKDKLMVPSMMPYPKLSLTELVKLSPVITAEAVNEVLNEVCNDTKTEVKQGYKESWLNGTTVLTESNVTLEDYKAIHENPKLLEEWRRNGSVIDQKCSLKVEKERVGEPITSIENVARKIDLLELTNHVKITNGTDDLLKELGRNFEKYDAVNSGYKDEKGLVYVKHTPFDFVLSSYGVTYIKKGFLGGEQIFKEYTALTNLLHMYAGNETEHRYIMLLDYMKLLAYK